MNEPLHVSARPPAVLLVGGLLVLLVALVTVAVSVGAVPIPLRTVWGVALERLSPGLVARDWPEGVARIVWDIRFPRALLAAVTGAGLAAVGAVLQGTTRNALADPYLFGISAGAALGAVTVITRIGDVIGIATLPLAAFLGAALSFVLVLAVSGTDEERRPDRLVLAGVAVSFMLMAATNALIFIGDHRAAHSVVFWMLGGLGLARWDNIWIAVAATAAGLVLFLAQARSLDALLLGEETAKTLGVSPGRLRLILFAGAALVSGVLVSLTGAIGFVGLMIPHVARILVGPLSSRLLVAAALMGACFLVGVDALARTLTAPQELPLGILTSAFGGAFAVWLLRARRGIA
ncbi:iron ABC transporter permease [Chelatococcus sp. SYSU_G07232]|uniref:Iron ABC transporter permease n=1 Tax=Chelatococcus albus TaxID=3047466 RepID=A0ABT7AFZ1_9HYPH|nr:iron ABC transporter permease [Chelatococcus sp. SYSU_G07232]MDJ1157927.1 iron ABC transporter permease [Chelatococcus sp. SYSU_G07232]